MTRGYRTERLPLQMRWSVPQRPASVTWTSTSPAPGSGGATAWTRRSRGPWRTAAFMADNLPGGMAAVQEDRLTGHEGRRLRRQIDGQGPDLLGPPDPAHGDVSRETLVDLRVRERGIGHVRGEPARRDRVHLDPVAGPLDAEGPREGDDAALGGGVEGVAGQPHLPQDRRD